MTPIYMGGNNENDRVASPESVPIHLKWIIILQNKYWINKNLHDMRLYSKVTYNTEYALNILLLWWIVVLCSQ